jgi:hypothetical protein
MHRGYFGMQGLGITSQQITSTVGGSLMASAGVVALIPGGQLPAAIIAAVGALTNLIGGLFKPDITKIQASQIVDQIEAQTLKPMRVSWQALPANQKTVSMQAHYLNVFDQAWSAVMQGCSNPALGSAGQNCIGDRQRGACHYTQTGQTPGAPPNCGNWFVWYRDPIANDPNVIPDPVAGVSTAPGSVTGAIDSTVSSVSQALGGISPLWIGLGIIVAAFMVSD